MEKNFKFNARELDQQFLLTRAHSEANEIYCKPSTRRDRSYNNILETVLYGHAAEVYLIEKHGFKDDSRIYKDVIDPQNNPIEVKVTEGEYYVPYVLQRANKAKSETWRRYPDILYVFIGDKKTADYTLHGIFNWNKKEFVLQKDQNSL